jgi:DNA invertase Pin-like site-specific DNA recombinase
MANLTPAAQYLRRSTEHQQYSLENQADVIRDYASKNSMQIIETYSDASSGMEVRRRKGLRKLLDDVRSGNALYTVILVYDVSRWGRFLDADEAAYYEFLCKLSGICIHYCAETFQNDNNLLNFLLKSMKRMMAGEYVRELSDKVVAGQKRLASLGFRSGSGAGYGLRRMLVSKDGKPKQVLRDGERKSIHDDRIVLVHGPKQETDIVREIHQMYLDGKKLKEIAAELNRRGVIFPGNKRNYWYSSVLSKILHSPKYNGSMVYGRTTQKLKTTRKRQPEDAWIVCPDAWEHIVDSTTFERVQNKYHSRPKFKSDDDLLEDLRQLKLREGRLHQRMLRTSRGIASWGTYKKRFGSFGNALQLIQHDHGRQTIVASFLRYQALKRKLLAEIVDASNGEVSIVKARTRGHFRTRLKLRNGTQVSVYVCRYDLGRPRPPQWVLSEPEARRISLIARLRPDNKEFLDFHLIQAVPCSRCWRIKANDLHLREGIELKSPQDFAAAVEKIYRGRPK